MSVFRYLSFLLSVVCLSAQTPPAPNPATQAPPKVKLEMLRPKEGNLPEVPPDTVIMRIGEEKITAGEFSMFIETLPEQVRGQARGSARKQLAENLIKVKLIAQEARRKQADQDKLFQVQSAYQTDNLLAVYYLNGFLKTAKVPEEEMKKYYEDHKKDFETMRGRHILIRSAGSQVPLKPGQKELSDEEALAKAQELRKRIQAGANFAQVAKDESDDSGSGATGGSLGEFRHGMMVGPFDEAASTLPLGEISEPVKSQFGYHLIQIQGRDIKTYEEVKDEIDKKLRPQLTEKFIDGLKTKSPVSMDESYFNVTPAPAPTPVAPAPVPPTPK